MSISGKTQYVPLIGQPIAQVSTPPMFNRWAAQADEDVVMVPMELPPDTVHAYFDVLRGSPSIVGCSVTVPHKQQAFAEVDAATDRARVVGAVNIIRRQADGTLVGDMTDGLALRSALESAAGTLAGASIVVVGAGGGAGAAISLAIAEASPQRLTLLEASEARREAVFAAIRACCPDVLLDDTPELRRHDVVVNATPLGMRPGDPLPADPEWLVPGGVAADAVTKPQVTRFLEAAHALGAVIVTGHQMAEAQLSFQIAHLGYAKHFGGA